MCSSKAARIFVLAFLALVGVASCKTAQESETQTTQQSAKSPQCNPQAGFKGTCQVVDLSGRQSTTTAAARQSQFAEVVELRLVVAPTSGENHTQVTFLRKSGYLDDWGVNQALDLYSRGGCIAEISGGAFGDGFTPKMTVRVLMNLNDDARTAFAEVSDFRQSSPIAVTLALKCDWQP